MYSLYLNIYAINSAGIIYPWRCYLWSYYRIDFLILQPAWGHYKITWQKELQEVVCWLKRTILR